MLLLSLPLVPRPTPFCSSANRCLSAHEKEEVRKKGVSRRGWATKAMYSRNLPIRFMLCWSPNIALPPASVTYHISSFFSLLGEERPAIMPRTARLTFAHFLFQNPALSPVARAQNTLPPVIAIFGIVHARSRKPDAIAVLLCIYTRPTIFPVPGLCALGTSTPPQTNEKT